MEERWKEMITVRITVKLLGAIKFGIDAADRWLKTWGKARRNGRGEEGRASERAVKIFE